MANTIQKATKGNYAALQALCSGNSQLLYYLCRALTENEASAAGITYRALKHTVQALPDGNILSEGDFQAHAIRQAVSECTQEVLKKEPKAFRVPAKKDFRLLHIPEASIDPKADALENYLKCIPTLHRYILVLHCCANMPIGQIGICVGMESGLIRQALDAQTENLGKIYRVLKAAGVHGNPPTLQMLKTEFTEAVSNTILPEELQSQITELLMAFCAPARAREQKKKRTIAALVAVTAVLAIGLAATLTASGNSEETAEATTAATETTEATEESTEATTAEETEVTEPFDITEATEDASEETEPAAVSAACTALIEIEDYGTITVALDSESAPITVANFVELAEGGFYDGLTFHRIIEDFMMQGGDPNGDGTGGSEENIVGEFTDNGHDNDLSHTRGAISMARSNDYDSASSQFFIVHEDSTYLDGQYAVFGYVTDGMDIVDEICESAEPTDSNGSIDPAAQPVIKSITIQTQE